MKRILSSLVTIVSLLTVVSLSTSAVFSSTATVADNTYATGTLEIRVNGQPEVAGFSMTNAVPGDCKLGTFTVQNYGAPWFAGPSTLPAKELVISSANQTGDTDLYDALTVEIGADRGWGSWMPVYDGSLNSLFEGDLLTPRWTDLAAGNSEVVQYNVCLPIDAGDELQGKSTSFDFVVTAYNPVRP